MTEFAAPTVLGANCFQTTANPTAVLSPHAGAQPGDVLVYWVAYDPAIFTYVSVPPGWYSEELAAPTASRRLRVARGVLTAESIATPGQIVFSGGGVAVSDVGKLTVGGAVIWRESRTGLAMYAGTRTAGFGSNFGGLTLASDSRNGMMVGIYWAQSLTGLAPGIFNPTIVHPPLMVANASAFAVGGSGAYATPRRIGRDYGVITLVGGATTDVTREWIGAILEVEGMHTPPWHPVGTFRPDRVYEPEPGLRRRRFPVVP